MLTTQSLVRLFVPEKKIVRAASVGPPRPTAMTVSPARVPSAEALAGRTPSAPAAHVAPWAACAPVYRPGVGHYQGSMRGGARHGDGAQTWECCRRLGSVYAGQWRDDTAHGDGSLTIMPDQIVAHGAWRAGRMHGSGCRVALPDGSSFSGAFRDGLPDGPDCEWYQAADRLRFRGRYAKGRALRGEVVDEKKSLLDSDGAGEPSVWAADGKDRRWDWGMLIGLEALVTDGDVEEMLRPDDWIKSRTADLTSLWDSRQEMVLGFVERYAFELEEGVPFSAGNLGALATRMWDQIPSAHLFTQTQALATIDAKHSASCRAQVKEAEDDFLELAMKADEDCAFFGRNSFHSRQHSSTRSSLGVNQHAKFFGELLVGRAEEIEADGATGADLLVDLTRPPCKPGDMEYVAKVPFKDTSKIMKTYNGEQHPRKFVDRYCGHVLRPIKPRVDASVENLLGDDEEISEKMIRHRMHGDTNGKGCPKVVSGGASNDLVDASMHIPAYSDKSYFDPIILASRRLGQVDYMLGPKPARENTEDQENAVESERSFKLVCSQGSGDGAGTFQVATCKAQGAVEKSDSKRIRADRSSPGVSVKSSSSWGAHRSEHSVRWSSEGMLLPGFQREIGKIPEVVAFRPLDLTFHKAGIDARKD